MSHVFAARALVPGMLARGSGYLLNTASAAGLLASLNSMPYGVTKHAAVALAEHLAIQYGDRGIRVSVLCPQSVQTGMTTAGPSAARVDGVMTPQMAVRRLTPRECERLQGFPDDYTLVEYRGKPAADGPRYKALGNSMAVPVMRWIGQRSAAVDAILRDGSGDGRVR